MRFTQLAQVMPTTGSVSSSGAVVGVAVMVSLYWWGVSPQCPGTTLASTRRRMSQRMRILPSGDPGSDPHRTSDAAGSSAPAVFIVDDDPLTLELLSEVAYDAGWTVHRFTRLQEVRRRLDVESPTLLILDDDLPDGRGGDLARELRRNERLADTPVLVCTAAQPIRQAEIGSWAPVVSKPFDLAEIDAFLDASARLHRRSDSCAERAG